MNRKERAGLEYATGRLDEARGELEREGGSLRERLRAALRFSHTYDARDFPTRELAARYRALKANIKWLDEAERLSRRISDDELRRVGEVLIGLQEAASAELLRCELADHCAARSGERGPPAIRRR